MNKYDPSGLGSKDTHYRMAKDSAMSVGFGPGIADMIGDASAKTDSLIGGNGPWPCGLGDQSRHFNLLSGGLDSRDFWARIEFKNAVKLWSQGQFNDAIDSIGRGVHSIEDKLHRDWDPTAKYLPDVNIHPDWYDDLNDPRNSTVRVLIEAESKTYLGNFLSEIKNLQNRE